MAAGCVTLLSSFEFTFRLAESCAALCNLGHNLPQISLFWELIMRGWDGLNLANSKELFIGTVNVTNFDQMPDCSYWQFVIHGLGAIKANEPCLTRLQLADMPWKFQSIVKVTGKLLVCYWSLVRDLFLALTVTPTQLNSKPFDEKSW